MPEKRTIQRARKAKREGKSPTTQAGEFVREEIHHVREGKHGARSPKQAIAIGLSKARRSGVRLPPPPAGSPSARRSRTASRRTSRRSPARSRAVMGALQREPRGTTSRTALARQTRSAAARRSSAKRSAAARKAARTKGPAGRSAAARKAARTRARRR